MSVLVSVVQWLSAHNAAAISRTRFGGPQQGPKPGARSGAGSLGQTWPGTRQRASQPASQERVGLEAELGKRVDIGPELDKCRFCYMACFSVVEVCVSVVGWMLVSGLLQVVGEPAIEDKRPTRRQQQVSRYSYTAGRSLRQSSLADRSRRKTPLNTYTHTQPVASQARTRRKLILNHRQPALVAH